MGKASAPPPPDYSQIAAASEAAAKIQAEVAREQLAWAKEQYASDKAITGRVVDDFLNISRINQENAAADRARYEQLYQPLENQLVNDATAYASPQRQELEASRAAAAVAQQFDQIRDQQQAQLERYGIDPSQVRSGALDLTVRLGEAGAKAGAANQARLQTENIGRALRSEAINVGRGYPSQIASTYGTALQAGSGAVGNNLATTASGASTMGTAPQYYGLSNQSLGIWGNTLNMSYQNQLAAYQAQNSAYSGLGGLFGTILGAGTRAFLAEGGAIPEEASPSGGAYADDVVAQVNQGGTVHVNEGEYVIPRDVTRWKGEMFFHKLINKSREEAYKARGVIPDPREGQALLPDDPAASQAPQMAYGGRVSRPAAYPPRGARASSPRAAMGAGPGVAPVPYSGVGVIPTLALPAPPGVGVGREGMADTEAAPPDISNAPLLTRYAAAGDGMGAIPIPRYERASI